MCRNDAVVIDCAKLETASLRYGKTASEDDYIHTSTPPEFLALKQESRILGHSFNPV